MPKDTDIDQAKRELALEAFKLKGGVVRKCPKRIVRGAIVHAKGQTPWQGQEQFLDAVDALRASKPLKTPER